MSTFALRLVLTVVLVIFWNALRVIIGFKGTVIAALALIIAYEGVRAEGYR